MACNTKHNQQNQDEEIVVIGLSDFINILIKWSDKENIKILTYKI